MAAGIGGTLKEYSSSTQRVAGAHQETFEYLGGSWARDRARIYSAGAAIKAEASSFLVLSYVFAKDSDHVYYLGGRVPEAHTSTFESLDSGCHFAAPGAHPVSYAGYGRDAEAVFHYTFTIGKPCVVRGAHASTFRCGVRNEDAMARARQRCGDAMVDWVLAREATIASMLTP